MNIVSYLKIKEWSMMHKKKLVRIDDMSDKLKGKWVEQVIWTAYWKGMLWTWWKMHDMHDMYETVYLEYEIKWMTWTIFLEMYNIWGCMIHYECYIQMLASYNQYVKRNEIREGNAPFVS